ncbi:MAG TPA: hypothetical protein VL137_18815, partial [Polyangiaceae bacterium]|nr:hypothetical protein [Polyangiaceae bacterium]
MRGLSLAACCVLLLGAAGGCRSTPSGVQGLTATGSSGGAGLSAGGSSQSGVAGLTAGGSATLTAGGSSPSGVAGLGSTGLTGATAGAATSGGGVAAIPVASSPSENGGTPGIDGSTPNGVLTKTATTKIYAHLMPWFETPESNGAWGIHWKMANQNPDVTDANGKRQI